MGNQQMDVVGDRTSLEQSTFLLFHNAADVGVEFLADIIGQPWFPVLRGEDQMHEDLGKTVSPFQFTGQCTGVAQTMPLCVRGNNTNCAAPVWSPKGSDNEKAQDNVLGLWSKRILRPEGGATGDISPFQGSEFFGSGSQGVALG